MDRRRFLASAAGAGLAGLAGCTEASGSVAPPQVPEERLDEGGWEKQSESEETVFEQSYAGGAVTVSATAFTMVYEDVALRDSVRSKTLGQVQGKFAIFAATRVDISPSLDDLPAGVGQAQILDRVEASARDGFRARMQEAGLTNVARESTGSLTVDTGEDARHTAYSAEFAFDPFSFPVTEDRTITVEGDALAVGGDLAVWKHGDFVLVAGGAYPGQNFSRSIERDLTEAITVSVDIDLGMTPDAYREEVRGLVTGVE